MEVSSLSSFGVMGSILTKPSSAITTNLANFLASRVYFMVAFSTLTIAISTLVQHERFAIKDPTTIFFLLRNQVLTLIPNDRL